MAALRRFRSARSIAAVMLLVAIAAVGIAGAWLHLQRVEAERIAAESDAAINADITRQKQLADAENARVTAKVDRMNAENPTDPEEYRKALESAKRRRARPEADEDTSHVFRHLGTWPESR